MESDIALELWQKSPDYGIYFKYMVTDGAVVIGLLSNLHMVLIINA